MKFIIGKEFDKKRLFVVKPSGCREQIVIAKDVLDAEKIMTSSTIFRYFEYINRFDENTIKLYINLEILNYSVQKLLDCLPYGAIGFYLGQSAENFGVYHIHDRYYCRLEKQ